MNFLHFKSDTTVASATMILMHGWSGSAESLAELGKLLAKKGADVYVLDLPGFGGTTIPEKAYTLDDYLAELKSFILTEKIEKPILVGHSFGGKIALKLAAVDSKYLKAIVAIGASGVKPKNSLKKRVLNSVAKTGKGLSKLPLLGIFAEPATKLFYKLIVREQDYYKSGKLKETFVNIVNEHLDDLVAKIKIPTVLIWGENDSVTPVWMGQALQQKITNSVLIIEADSRHDLPKVKPEIVAEIIYNELNKLKIF